MSKRSRNRGIVALVFSPAPIPLIAPESRSSVERAPAAGDELAEVGVEPGRVLVVPDVEIVHEQEVDRR